MNYPKFKVTVSCMTFNQATYITDAMNGFTMQQTDFPFVCTIVDDASTDGEQEVIRKYVEENFDFSEGSVAYHKETDYANITYAQHKTNRNCYFAVLYLKENHYSNPDRYRGKKNEYLREWRDGIEYMALCEGDDYWIDSLKLETQVRLLDNNPSCSLSSHGHIRYDMRSGVKRNIHFNSTKTLRLEEMLSKPTVISTNSIVYRKACLKNLGQSFINENITFDYAIKTVLAMEGDVIVLPSIMSVYRAYANMSWTVQARSDKKFYINHLQHSIRIFTNICSYYAPKEYKVLNEEIIKREMIVALYQNDYEKLNQSPWKEMYKSLSLCSRFKYSIIVRHPYIYSITKRIKIAIQRIIG